MSTAQGVENSSADESGAGQNKNVVVVGAGNAGLVAALAAREAGAHVIVLESASCELRGGNSRFSGAIFRAAHTGLDSIAPLLCESSRVWLDRVDIAPYTTEDYLADWLKVTAGRPDRALVDTVIGNSYETLAWMQGQGVEWELTVGKLFQADAFEAVGKQSLPPGGAIRARHEGVGLVENLFTAVEKAGIEIRYESPAIGLMTSGSRIDGVLVRSRDQVVEVPGVVVLAAGGFESNPEMRARYLGEGWDVVKVRGTRFNMGTMLTAAMTAGAKPVGHWQGCHAAPIDAGAPPVGDLKMTDKYSRYSFPYSVMVNVNAERFIDEGEDQVWLTYAKTGSAVRAQPTGVAFQIFDQQAIPLLEPRYSTGTPIEAGTIEELAGKLGLPAAALRRTVDDFNAAVPDDAKERFDPQLTDGVRAEPAGQPVRSNWARRIEEPPFVVYPVACGITFTYGGLTVDTTAQVLDTEGRVMPDLFATGEITGDFFYFNYTAGAGLMRGAVLGRLAGEHAAAAAVAAG
jgi:tricarballylate dehydrogenase